MESKVFFIVFAILVSNTDGRTLHKLHKRAAFYIANETACVVDNTVYYNGDPIPTDDPCEACKCRPPGFACVLKDCEVKPGCRAVRRTGHCCPDYICGCEHNGRMYRDGDEIRDSQNPCYTCHCQGSAIACAFVDCFFRVDCAPEYVTGECCPRYDHCGSTDSTPNATFPTVPTLVSEISTTSSVTDERRASAYLYDKPLTTILTSDEDTFTHPSSLATSIETQKSSESGVVYVDSFSPTIPDSSGADEKSETPHTSTFGYEKDKSSGELESDKIIPESASDKNIGYVDSSSLPTTGSSSTTEMRTEAPDIPTLNYGKDKSSDEVKSDTSIPESTSDEHTEAETKPEEAAEITLKPDEESFEKDVNSGPLPPLYVEDTSSDIKTDTGDLLSTESTAVHIDSDENGKVTSEVFSEKLEDSNADHVSESLEGTSYTISESRASTTSDPQIKIVNIVESKNDKQELHYLFSADAGEPAAEEQSTTSAVETTTLKVPIPLVYLHHSSVDESKQSEPVSNKDLNLGAHTEGVQPEEHDSAVNEILLTTQLPEEKNLLLPKDSAESDRKPKGKADEGHEISDGEGTTPKIEENDPKHEEVAEKNESKKDRGLKTASQSAEVQETEQQDVTSTTFDLQELSTPVSLKSTSDEKIDENRQEIIKTEKNADESDSSKQRHGVKTASKIQNEAKAQKTQQNDDVIYTIEEAVEELQLTTLSPQRTKSQETVNDQNQELQDTDKTIHPSEDSDDKGEKSHDLAKHNRSVKTTSNTANVKEAQKAQHQYDIISPSVETTLDETQQPTIAPQQTENEKVYEVKSVFPSEKESGEKINNEGGDSRQNLGIKTVSSSSASNTAVRRKEQRVDNSPPSPQTTSDQDESAVSASQNAKSTETNNEEGEGTTKKEGATHDHEDHENKANIGEGELKQDRSVKTSTKSVSKQETQEAVQQDAIRPPSTELISQEQTPPKEQNSENQRFPTWEQIGHRYQGGDHRVGHVHHDSRQHKSIKTGSNSESDTEGQETKGEGDDIPPSSETTVRGDETSAPTFENAKSKVNVNNEKQDKKGISHSPEEHESEDDSVQDDSKQDHSVKTAGETGSETGKQEVKQLGDITQPTTEVMLNDSQPSTPQPQRTKSKEVSSGADDSKQDRSVKTPSKSTSKTEAQGTVQHDDIRPTSTEIILQEQQLSTPASQKTKAEAKNSEEQSFPKWEEIIHKSQGNGYIGSVIHHDSRQDRSIKTGSNGAADAETQHTTLEEDITSPLPETSFSDNEQPLRPLPQATKFKDSIDQEMHEAVSKKGIVRKPEEDEIKEDRSVKTDSKSGSKTEAQESEQFDANRPPTTEIILDQQHLTTPTSKKGEAEEYVKVAQDDSKKGRDVKTASKSTSKTETQETLLQDGIGASSTEIILQEEHLTTPTTQKTRPKEKSKEEQRFPSWDEIHYKNEETVFHSRQSRSVETDSNSSSYTETQNTEQYEATTSPSPAITLEDNKPSTPAFQNIKSKDSVSKEELKSANENGTIHEPEEHENEGSDGNHDSKQDRSVKTATRVASTTEAQVTVKQYEVTPSSTESFLDEEQKFDSGSRKTKPEEKIGGEQRFPSWEEIAYKSESSRQIADNARADRNVKTANRAASTTEAQVTVKQYEVTPSSTAAFLDEEQKFDSGSRKTKPEEKIGEQRFPNWEEIAYKSESSRQIVDNARADRNVKTANRAASTTEAQVTVKQYEVTPSSTAAFLDEEQKFDSGSRKTKPEEKIGGEQRFPNWEEIAYKSESSGQIADNVREDRDVKTATRSTSTTEAQETVKQDVIIPSSTETSFDDKEISNRESQKGKENDSEEPKFPSWEEIIYKSGRNSHIDSIARQNRNIKALNKVISDKESAETEQQDDIKPESALDEPSVPVPQNTKSVGGVDEERQETVNKKETVHKSEEYESKGSIGHHNSEHDKGVKTVSKSASGEKAQESVQLDDITLPSTEVILTEDQLSAPTSQKTKSKQKEHEEQRFPSREETGHKSGENDQTGGDFRQGRGIKTASSKSSDTDAQKAEQQEDITSPQETALDEEDQGTASNKGIIRKPEEHENQDNVQLEDSKKGRGVKTAVQSASATDAQETVQQDVIRPTSTESVLEVEQQTTLEFQKTKSEQKVNEESYQKSSVQQNDSKEDRSVKTAIKSVSENEAQKTEQQDGVTFSEETTLDKKSVSDLAPQAITPADQNDAKDLQQIPNKKDVSLVSDDSHQKDQHGDEKSASIKHRSIKTSVKTHVDTPTAAQYDDTESTTGTTLYEQEPSTPAPRDVPIESSSPKQGNALSKKQNNKDSGVDPSSLTSTDHQLDDDSQGNQHESSSVTSATSSTTPAGGIKSKKVAHTKTSGTLDEDTGSQTSEAEET